MDWLTFVSKLVDALAWPVAATVIALHFREQIKLLLGKIRTAKGVGIEFSFAQEVERVAAAAAATTMNVDVPAVDTPAGPVMPESSSTVPQFVEPSEAERPSARVLESWRQIERAILTVIRKKGGYVPQNQTLNPGAWLNALKKEKALPPDTFELISDLYRLRNQVAHASEFEPDIRTAKNYESSASKVIDILGRAAQVVNTVL